MQIISIISDKTHYDEDRGRRFLFFLDAILQAADRYKANEHRLQPFSCKKLVDTCKECMNAVVGASCFDHSLWKTF